MVIFVIGTIVIDFIVFARGIRATAGIVAGIIVENTIKIALRVSVSPCASYFRVVQDISRNGRSI